jgi:hypothetical protein
MQQQQQQMMPGMMPQQQQQPMMIPPQQIQQPHMMMGGAPPAPMGADIQEQQKVYPIRFTIGLNLTHIWHGKIATLDASPPTHSGTNSGPPSRPTETGPRFGTSLSIVFKNLY